VLQAIPASRTSPRQAVIHSHRAASFLRRIISGSKRIGSRIHEVDAPETVSLKTTVT
jgi:hypothetical protein